jgi:D-tyrosyl-tRNA(Tyr) deacylase
MRAVVQRVARAAVHVEGRERGRIGAGLVVLVSVGPADDEASCDRLAAKVAALRIFPDAAGKMNVAAGAAGAEVLVISQFTLHADTTAGNRPSFIGAAPPPLAERLYERFLEHLRRSGGLPVVGGVFGAHMVVELANDGPVTLVVSTEAWDTRV